MTSSGIRLIGLHAAVLALVASASAMAADEVSRVHDCGDGRKTEGFPSKDIVMEARVADLTVRISVREAIRIAPLGTPHPWLALCKGPPMKRTTLVPTPAG